MNTDSRQPSTIGSTPSTKARGATTPAAVETPVKSDLETFQTEAANLRHLGIGRLALSADVIQDTILQLNVLAESTLETKKPLDLQTVVPIFRLIRDLNRMLIRIGVAEIRSAPPGEAAQTESNTLSPYPCGTPLEIAR